MNAIIGEGFNWANRMVNTGGDVMLVVVKVDEVIVGR